MKFWPDLINAIRARCDQKNAKDMIISLAVPAVPANGYPGWAGDEQKVLDAYTAPLFERIDESVNFYNLMT